jgi:CDP-glucose 4,6-dehydratase
MTPERFWSQKRVLVTGAGGFIGSWVAHGLVARGADVFCVVLPGLPNEGLDLTGIRDRVRVEEIDLVDLQQLREAVAGYDPDSCFHLAAQPIVGAALPDPLPTFEANIRGTWNLLECCRERDRLERVVVASSDKAYGDQDRLPYTEDLPLEATYPYDASKACSDILARCYARTYGLPVAITRAANVYGGGDLNFSRIVPGTIRSILRDEDPIIRSDGTPLRDYVYVDDVVEGYLALAERLPDPALSGEAFNLGANAPLSVTEIVRLILAEAGNPPLEPRILGNGELREIKAQFLDSSKALRVLEWRATTPISDGIERTLAWYRDHEALL